MIEKRKPCETHHLDPQEFDLPETTYSRGIENRVFQEIVLNVLSRISGIGLLQGTFLDHLIGRIDRVPGISAEQDSKTQSVKICVEIAVHYGIHIPSKAEEIQTAVVEEITKMTGLRVSEIHVVFKELVRDEATKEASPSAQIPVEIPNEFKEELQSEF